jgi:uncharacterized protein (DUF924 family)
VIVLSQFSRHIFRGTAQAFAPDPLARQVALRAIKRGFDQQTELPLRNFFYFPFMLSEEVADQERILGFFRGTGDVNYIKHAEIHFEIIRNFGRFPHRNSLMGRLSKPEETAFLSNNEAFPGFA